MKLSELVVGDDYYICRGKGSWVEVPGERFTYLGSGRATERRGAGSGVYHGRFRALDDAGTPRPDAPEEELHVTQVAGPWEVCSKVRRLWLAETQGRAADTLNEFREHIRAVMGRVVPLSVSASGTLTMPADVLVRCFMPRTPGVSVDTGRVS